MKPEEVLRFEPEKHEYFLGKKKVPSVSQILQKVGLAKDFSAIDPFYRDRGIATHSAIELHLKGILDPKSLDEAIKPQFEAFLAYWKDHSEEKVLALEKPMVDLPGTFAGTPDLVTEKAIRDWKCSKSHDKVASLQGQAYKNLVFQNWMQLRHSPTDLGNLPFIVVELHDDGTYMEYDYGTGYEQWSSVMDLYRWRLGK